MDEGEDGSVLGEEMSTKEESYASRNVVSQYIDVLRSQHSNVPWIIFIALLSSISESIWSGTLLSIGLYNILQSNTKARK